MCCPRRDDTGAMAESWPGPGKRRRGVACARPRSVGAVATFHWLPPAVWGTGSRPPPSGGAPGAEAPGATGLRLCSLGPSPAEASVPHLPLEGGRGSPGLPQGDLQEEAAHAGWGWGLLVRGPWRVTGQGPQLPAAAGSVRTEPAQPQNQNFLQMLGAAAGASGFPRHWGKGAEPVTLARMRLGVWAPRWPEIPPSPSAFRVWGWLRVGRPGGTGGGHPGGMGRGDALGGLVGCRGHLLSLLNLPNCALSPEGRCRAWGQTWCCREARAGGGGLGGPPSPAGHPRAHICAERARRAKGSSWAWRGPGACPWPQRHGEQAQEGGAGGRGPVGAHAHLPPKSVSADAPWARPGRLGRWQGEHICLGGAGAAPALLCRATPQG